MNQYSYMPMFADILAKGIVNQFPNKFQQSGVLWGLTRGESRSG